MLARIVFIVWRGRFFIVCHKDELNVGTVAITFAQLETALYRTATGRAGSGPEIHQYILALVGVYNAADDIGTASFGQVVGRQGRSDCLLHHVAEIVLYHRPRKALFSIGGIELQRIFRNSTRHVIPDITEFLYLKDQRIVLSRNILQPQAAGVGPVLNSLLRQVTTGCIEETERERCHEFKTVNKR